MKKDERILDLVAFLLNAREPVSFEEIQNAFPDDYRDGDEAAIARKFERDKADILALGLPLQFVMDDDSERSGYWIDRQRCFLPPLALKPEELAALYFAGSAVLGLEGSPFQRDLLLALAKIGLSVPNVGGESPTLHALETTDDARFRERLALLADALARRKTLTLTYHSFWRDQVCQRRVDPWGLAYRRGSWVMVGYCHLRKAVRVFHVDRIRALATNPHKPKTPDFEFPPDFRLSEHVAPEPWRIPAHAETEVRLRFFPPRAESAVQELGPFASSVERSPEAHELTLSVTYLDGLLPTILGYRDQVQVLAPPALVERTVAALRRLIEERT